ncbi:MAG TPA: RecX family transcriptional regulator [Solirubrobacteraceae bacterium]|jgi:regulatory protein|nr:RecX family transcriptional regulator [Solirubrobacteraceae bacterium]
MSGYVDMADKDPLTDALARCYSHLARREHSAAELRDRLERARIDAKTAEQALAIVIEQGYVNDERYARLLAEDRRNIDGWGVARIRDRMQRAGLDRGLIESTLSSFDEASECLAATDLLRRRFPMPPQNARERQRAFALLVRQGFGYEVAYDALRRHTADAADAAA